jgi:hypothetical protein
VTGHARLHPDGDVTHEVFGGIVDVSAGGARLRVRPDYVFAPGAPFVVDLEVSMPESRGPVPPVRLRGRGVTVRFDANQTARGAELSLRFEGPLLVCDGIGVSLPAFAIPASEASASVPTRA